MMLVSSEASSWESLFCHRLLIPRKEAVYFTRSRGETYKLDQQRLKSNGMLLAQNIVCLAVDQKWLKMMVMMLNNGNETVSCFNEHFITQRLNIKQS